MRKSKLLIIVLVLAFGYQLNAQIGAKIGYNFAKAGGDDIGDQKFQSNMLIGAFFEKDLIPFLDIRIGVDYSPKGYKLDTDPEIGLKVNYLEIPAQAKIKLGPVYALGGVYAGYALNGESTILGVNKTLDFGDSNLKRLDYGMKFGLGFQAGLGPIHVFGQTEYSFGLLNIEEEDGETKNKVLSFSVGVSLGFE